MSSIAELMQLCRLCLVKDQVDVPIFEDSGDLHERCLKIAACLPVKVKKDDKLPKKICSGCSYKLDLLYQFYNTSASADKQLKTWLSQLEGGKTIEGEVSSKESLTKSEPSESGDAHSLSADAESYIMQQQKLPYQNVAFPFQEDAFVEPQPSSSGLAEETETRTPSKRKRKTIQTLPVPDSDEEDDPHSKIAKLENDSDSDNDNDNDNFIPDDTSDSEQPGPSGLGKVSGDTPYEYVATELSRDVKTEPILKCDICNKSFDDEEEFSSHVAKTNKPFPTCCICGVAYNYRGNLRKHFVKYHKNGETQNPYIKQKTRGKKLPISYLVVSEPNLIPGVIVKTEPNVDQSLGNNSLLEKALVKNTSSKKKTNLQISGQSKVAELSSNVDVTNMKQENMDLTSSNEDIKNFAPDMKIFIEDITDNAEEVEVFTCDICQETFADKVALAGHRLIHNQPYVCPYCSRQFNNDKFFDRHLATHTKKGYLSCPHCDKKLKFKRNLEMHIATHTQEGYLPCKYCDRQFLKADFLKRHEEVCAQGGNFCQICNQTFKSKYNLKGHMETVHNKIQFPCEICKKTFSTLQYYKSHLVIHSPSYKKLVPCKICNKEISARFVRHHNLRHHSNRAKTEYVCQVCGKVFTTLSWLKVHLAGHEDTTKRFMCNHCGKVFQHQKNLKFHISTVHEKTREHVCSICDKKFTQRTSLSIHMRKHTGERPYQCNVCSEKFITKTIMGYHMKKAHNYVQN